MPAEAVIRSLRHVWATLAPLGVPMAVTGGIALASWRYVRATRDIDLLLGIGEIDLDEMLERLLAAEIRPKRDPPLVRLGQLDVIQLLYEPSEAFVDVQVDLLLARSEYHLEALERRVSTRLPECDIEIAVLTCEDLIVQKLLAGRVIDRVDAVALLRANRPSLELAYLARWTGELGLAGEFGAVWKEALPGEPPPAAKKGC